MFSFPLFHSSTIRTSLYHSSLSDHSLSACEVGASFMLHEIGRECSNQRRNRIEYNRFESHPRTLCMERYRLDREVLGIVHTCDSTMTRLLQGYNI